MNKIAFSGYHEDGVFLKRFGAINSKIKRTQKNYTG